MRLPKDDNGNPIPCLSYPAGDEGAFERAGSASQVASIITFTEGVEAFKISTDGKIKFALGTDNTVVASATSHGLHAGHGETISITDDKGQQLFTHLSIYFVDDATVYVSERE